MLIDLTKNDDDFLLTNDDCCCLLEVYYQTSGLSHSEDKFYLDDEFQYEYLRVFKSYKLNRKVHMFCDKITGLCSHIVLDKDYQGIYSFCSPKEVILFARVYYRFFREDIKEVRCY